MARPSDASSERRSGFTASPLFSVRPFPHRLQCGAISPAERVSHSPHRHEVCTVLKFVYGPISLGLLVELVFFPLWIKNPQKKALYLFVACTT